MYCLWIAIKAKWRYNNDDDDEDHESNEDSGEDYDDKAAAAAAADERGDVDNLHLHFFKYKDSWYIFFF